MTRPGGELTTYRARGGHAIDWANPTRSLKSKDRKRAHSIQMGAIIRTIDLNSGHSDRMRSRSGILSECPLYTLIVLIMRRSLPVCFLCTQSLNMGIWIYGVNYLWLWSTLRTCVFLTALTSTVMVPAALLLAGFWSGMICRLLGLRFKSAISITALPRKSPTMGTYYTNNEWLWVQWYRYFHEVRDGMFYSTRQSRVE